MRRSSKPAKATVEAKLLVSRKSRKNEGSHVADLENRLAEALKREAEPLDQQTPTADILRVISSSPTDVQPVFDTIARNATRLCEATHSSVNQFDGELLTLAATHGFTVQEMETGKEVFRAGPDASPQLVARC